MNLRNRIIAFMLLTACILIIFTGCKQSGIIKEDGQYYLIIEKSTNEANGSFDGCAMSPLVKFDTMQAMKNTLHSGNFTEEDMKEVRRMMDENGRVKLYDLDNAFNIVGWPSSHEIGVYKWYGHYYHISCAPVNTSSDSDGFHPYFYQTDKENADELIYEMSHYDTVNKNIKVTRSSDPITKKTYYSCTNYSGEEFVHCFFKIEDTNRTLYIFEKNINPTEKSYSEDSSVEMMICQGDMYVVMKAFNIQELPTDEWYLSWIIDKYEG